MNYKVLLYFFFTLLSTFAITGIDINKIIKKNHKWEAYALVLILSFAFGYLLTNFVVDFLEVSTLI